MNHDHLTSQRSPALAWSAFGDQILAILLTIKRERRTFQKQAARRRITLEQLTAAAIAGAVAEFVEAEETTATSPARKSRNQAKLAGQGVIPLAARTASRHAQRGKGATTG